MELKDCIDLTTRTESIPENIKTNPQLLVNVLALFTASGRMLDQVKKQMFYGKDYTIDNFNTDYQTMVSVLQHLTHFRLNGTDEDMGNEVLKDINPRLLHSIVGMATESTELCEALYDSLTNNKELDGVNLGEEYFDSWWYTFIGLDELDIDPEDMLEAGFEKLRKRYPDKFTADKAINRDLDTERKTLEKGMKIPQTV